MEQRLAKAEDCAQRPKPQADAPKATDLEVHADIIGRLQLLLEIVPLDLQTDSKRLIIILFQGRGDVPPVPGVTIDHHNLHRSQYPEKIRQLELIEKAEMSAVGKLLGALKQKTVCQCSTTPMSFWAATWGTLTATIGAICRSRWPEAASSMGSISPSM